MDECQWCSQTAREAMSQRDAVNGHGVPTIAVLGFALALLAIAVLRAQGMEATLRHEAYARQHALADAALLAARDEHALWLQTEATLARAATLAARGAIADAIALAGKAQREAGLARNQARLEAVRYQLNLQRDTLAPDDVTALESLLRQHDGAAALDRARRLGLAATP